MKLKINQIILIVFVLTVSIIALYLKIKAGKIESSNWDEAWFFSIADQGYMFDGNISKQQNVAFYPMFPLLAYIVHSLLPIFSIDIAMLLVTIGSTIITTFLTYKLVEHFNGEKVALYTVILWISSPFAFFMFLKYSDAVFFMFIVSFFYFMLVKKNYYLALLMINFASVTRMNGVFLIFIYVFHIFQLEDKKKLIEDVMLVPLGIVAWVTYSLFFFKQFANPLLMFDIYTAWGNSKIELGLKPILNLMEEAIHIKIDHTKNLGALILFIMLITISVNWKLIHKTVLTYSLFTLAFFILIYTPNTISLARYLLMVFPFFWVMSLLLSNKENPHINIKDYKVWIAAILMYCLNIYYNIIFLKGDVFVN